MDAHIQSVNPFRERYKYWVCQYLIEIIEIFMPNQSYTLPPLWVRCEAVVSPFHAMGEKWDLQGICIGITWDLHIFLLLCICIYCVFVHNVKNGVFP